LKKESAKTKKEAAEKVTPSKTKAAKELTDKSTSAKATKTAAAKEVKKTNSTTESKSSSTSKAKAKKETASQEKAPRVPDKVTGEYNGKKVYTGPRGGTYYINSNGNKTYIQQ
jgi:colicin import membrane protein